MTPRTHRPRRPSSSTSRSPSGPATPSTAGSAPRVSRWRRIRAAVAEDLPCYGLALASAVLLRLAFPRPEWWPLAWIALVPVMMGLRARPGLRGFFISWVFGALFSYFDVFWLNTLVRFNVFIPVGILAMGLFMGLWVALSGWGWSVLRDRYGALVGGIVGAFWWAGSEWLRSLGPYGFPWGLIGISQQPFVPLIQVLSLTGVYGLTFLIVLTNGFVADWTLARLTAWEMKRRAGGASPPAVPLIQDALRWAKVRIAGAVVLAILLSMWGCGRARSIEKATQAAADRDHTLVHLAVLQPDVMQSMKWESYTSPDPQRRDELQQKMFGELLDMLDSLAGSGAKEDLVVTPESAVTTPYFNLSEVNGRLQKELLERAHDLGAPILLGADDVTLFDQNGNPTTDLSKAVNPATELPWKDKMYVSAWLIPPDRPFDSTAVYHKVRLVPFGEWLPWFNVIPGFQKYVVQVGSFTPGNGPVLFAVPVRHGGWEAETPNNPRAAHSLDAAEPPQIRLATSICFESVFSDLHRWMARKGADLLANITNDAWYGRTSGPFQHFQIAVLRAVETGRPLVRCANTGITAIVSPAGRVLERLPFYEKDTLKAKVAVRRHAPLTLYTRWGDWWAVASLLIGLAGLIAIYARDRARSRPGGPNSSSRG